MDKMYSLEDYSLRNENGMKIIPILGTFDLKYKVPPPPKRLVYLLDERIILSTLSISV